MRVIVAHNRYVERNPSGENEAVEQEIAALTERGVEVIPHIRSSDEIGELPLVEKVTLPLRPLFSPWDAAEVSRLIEQHRPDLLHLHNPYPLISPGIVRVAKSRRVPVVQTVHNYRHVCAAGIFFRDGHPCHDCVGKLLPTPAIRHGCYRGSRPQSAAMAVAISAHRGTFRAIDRFIALSPNMVPFLQGLGIPTDQISVKPNTVEDPGTGGTSTGDGVLFVGRLSEEKGIRLLLDAWALVKSPARLTIVGDGPDRAHVERATRARDDVDLVGRLDAEGVQRAMTAAKVVVVPSLCEEVFPRVAIEALANARPVVTTAFGGLPDIIAPDVGWVVRPEPSDLARHLDVALSERSARERQAAARRRYETLYAPDVVMTTLLGIYDDVAPGSAGTLLG